MGTSAGNISVGIEIQTTPADAAGQVAKLTGLLGQYRQQASQLGATQEAAASSGRVFSLSIEQSREIMARVGGDFEKFKAEVLKLKEAYEGTAASVETLGTAQATATKGLGGLIPPGFGPNLTGNAFVVRRGADALSALAFAAAAGHENMQSLGLSAGSVTTALLSLSGEAIGLATGIGAVVTIGLTLIGVLANAGAEAKTTKKALDDLSGINLQTLQRRLSDTDALIQALERRREAAQRTPVGQPAGAGGAPGAVAIAQAQIDAIDRQLDELSAKRTAITDAILRAGPEAEKAITDQAIKGEDDALVAHVRRTQGEAAADRLAAKQRADEREKEIQDQEAAARQLGLKTDAFERALTANRAQFTTELEAINARERDRQASERAQADIQRAKATAQAAGDAAKITQQQGDAANEAARAHRQETERAFIDERLRLELNAINAEKAAQLQAIDLEIAARNKQLAGTTDLEARRKIAADVKADQDARAKAIADAQAKEAKARGDAGRAIADTDRKLADTVEQVTTDTLRAEGNLVEATSRELHKRFDDDIAEAKAAGDAIKAATLQRAIDLGVAAAKADELQHTGGAALAQLNADLQRTHALEQSGAISAAEAENQAVQAYERARAAIQALIPELQAAAAALTGPERDQQIRAVEALQTQYLELGVALDRLRDHFRELKAASTDALEQGIAQGLSEMTDGVHKFSDAWRDAAGSIVAALQRISSEMLATAIVQGALKALGGLLGGGGGAAGGGDIAGLLLHGAGIFAGVFAEGGVVRGPGGPRSDSIPARLSAGEYVVNAAAVKAVGVDFLEMVNRAGGFTRRSRLPGRFADGGFAGGFDASGLSALQLLDPASEASGQATGQQGFIRVLIEHPEESIVRVMESKGGVGATIRTLSRHQNAANHALGSR